MISEFKFRILTLTNFIKGLLQYSTVMLLFSTILDKFNYLLSKGDNIEMIDDEKEFSPLPVKRKILIISFVS